MLISTLIDTYENAIFEIADALRIESEHFKEMLEYLHKHGDFACKEESTGNDRYRDLVVLSIAGAARGLGLSKRLASALARSNYSDNLLDGTNMTGDASIVARDGSCRLCVHIPHRLVRVLVNHLRADI
jgi:hypothetical protein